MKRVRADGEWDLSADTTDSRGGRGMAKVGDVIQLTDDERLTLKPLIEREKDARAAFYYSITLMREQSDELFHALHEMHPELEGFNGTLHHETGRVTIVTKKIGV
jgi:hypothetical protein